jgi:3-oxoacyl-[acyl-carrier-protein] synthase-3
MKSFIKAVSVYLPEKILTNEELNNEFPEWKVFKLSKVTGINTRHISAVDEISSDMACKAAEKLFVEHKINRKTIDFIMFCTQSNDYLTPTTACILQKRLNIPTSCGAFDYNLGCTGYVYGLSIAKGLIESGSAKNILLLTAETITKYINPGDKSTRILFGDGATASLISSAKENSQSFIDRFIFGTDGRGYKNIILKYGGARFPLKDAITADLTDKYGNIQNETNFYMNGPAVFNFSIKIAPLAILQTLKKHKLKLDDVDIFVLHQANKIILDTIRQKLKLPREKFHLCIEDTGNTVSSTIPIALNDAINKGIIKNGSTVMLVAFGVGYSWASCIVKY